MKQASLYDLTDFAVASAVVEDFPKIMSMYDSLLLDLEPYQHYLAASSVISAVKDARTLMQMQLEQFQKIHDERGKIDNG